MSKELTEIKSKYPTETVDQAIYTAIREYLMHKKLYDTLRIFETERNSKKDVNELNKLTESQIKEVLKYLIEGHFEKYFTNIQNYIPLEILEKDPFYQKIEFFSLIYFASVNYSKNINNYNYYIQKFKTYLDTKGQEFSSNNELLPYFALPYVSNPHTHPIFKRFFEAKWKEDFVKKVEAFLYQAVTTKQSHPALVKMAQAWILFHKNKKDADVKQKMVSLLEQREDLVIEVRKLKKIAEENSRRESWLKNKYKEDSQKWSTVSRELLNLSSNLVKRMMREGGNEALVNDIADKIQSYNYYINLMSNDSAYTSESFLMDGSQDQGHGSQNYGKAYQQQFVNVEDQSASMASPDQYYNSALETTDDMLAGRKFMEMRKRYHHKLLPLNCEQVKQTLVANTQKISTICAILQALAWRLEYTSRMHSREQLVDLVQADILGIEEYTLGTKGTPSNPSEALGPVMDSLINKFGLKVKQYCIRLVNAMASDSVGRSYLLQNESIIYLLYQILKLENSETLLRQDALGALQKFSLRREPQDKMIELDLIKYLIYLIQREQYVMSDYSLEYTTALLMNLSLRTKGKDKCKRDADAMLELLISMLDHKNEYVRTYVNGILYSILSRESIKQKALRMNLDAVLNELAQHTEERFYRQYTYIKTQLMEPEKAESKSEVDDEDAEDFVDEEDEIDPEEGIEDEDLTQFGVEAGEDILRHFYVEREYKESFIDKSMNRSVLERKDNDSFFRPTTPSIKNSFVQRKPTPYGDESSSFIKQDQSQKFTNQHYDDSNSMIEVKQDTPQHWADQGKHEDAYSEYEHEQDNTQPNKSIVEELEQNDY